LVGGDPIVDALASRDKPFIWTDLQNDQKLAKMGAAALELAAADGWVEGFVVPLARGDGRIGIVSLAGHAREPNRAAKGFLCLISDRTSSSAVSGQGAV